MAKGVRKILFGYSTEKRSDGIAQGALILKLKPKNAYELLGLRKPAPQGAGRP